MANNVDLQTLQRLPIDFEEIVETLKNRVQSNLPNRWSDFLVSNFGIELLEAVAYEAMLMNYYTESSINECFLPTARTQTGVYNLAKTIGYKPSPASQSSVTLRFYLDKAINTNIGIPQYTTCTSNTGISFYTLEEATLYQGATEVVVDAKSGALNTDTFICNGIANYRYKLLNNNVNAILSVTVDDVEYSYVDFMDVNNKSGLYYTVAYDSDYYGYISFGDGTYGVNPSKNLVIKILYVTNASVSDNVDPYSITHINSVIYDYNNSIVNNINVINDDYSSGGSDAETLEEIKRNAPAIYRTQKRCVTEQDFKDMALAINGVRKVNVITNKQMDEIGIFGVKLCIIPETPLNGGYASEAFKREVLSQMDERKMVSTQVELVDPSYIRFNVNIGINVAPTAISKNVIINNIKNKVTEYLKWENRDFGEPVNKYDLFNLISQVPGVLNINNITIEEQRNIYVSKMPDIGSNILNVRDTMNVLQVGSIINIMNKLGATISDRCLKIINIDEDKYTLVYADNDEPFVVLETMQIGTYSAVYPILYTNGIVKYGTKTVYISNDNIADSNTEKRNMILYNLNYTTIYFNDDYTNTYQILFRIGDNLYLDKPVIKDIPDGSKITILYKKFVPVLSSTSYTGNDVINLTSYPRFGIGAYIYKTETQQYSYNTLSVYRSNMGIDYIGTYMNLEEFIKITKIYTDATNVFVENEDYELINDGTAIKWTDLGKAKLPVNSKYYIDIVKLKTNLENNVTDVKYYVKNIKGKQVFVSPVIKNNLYDETVLSFTTDNYNLTPWEIADVGVIEVNVGTV